MNCRMRNSGQLAFPMVFGATARGAVTVLSARACFWK